MSRPPRFDKDLILSKVRNIFASRNGPIPVRSISYLLSAHNIIKKSEDDFDTIGRYLTGWRKSGEIDWRDIIDGIRSYCVGPCSYDCVADYLDEMSRGYRKNPWASQPIRYEAWIEKAGLAPIIADALEPYNVRVMPCRGDPSLSVVFEAASDALKEYLENGRRTFIPYYGDHDGHGVEIDRAIVNNMRIIGDREGVALENFMIFKRVSLTFEEIRRLGLPSRPFKPTDYKRYKDYIAKYGGAWELDALEAFHPGYLARRAVRDVEYVIKNYGDVDKWNAAISDGQTEREVVRRVCMQTKPSKTLMLPPASF